jgi:hypothetical protein
MTVEALSCVVEWDEGTGMVTIGCGLKGRWEVIQGLQEALERGGVRWRDEALVERRGTRCFGGNLGSGVVLVWVATFEVASESRLVAEAIRAAMGVRGELG